MYLIRRFWEFLFNNFMWLYILMGLLSWVGIYPMTFQLLMFAGLLYSILLIPRFRISSVVDFFVIAYVVYLLLNSLLIDYDNHFKLWKVDLFYGILPMCFYFIAKSTNNEIDYYLNKMILPMTIVMIIGVALYIVNPPWYSALKYAQLFDAYGYSEGMVPENKLREAFRLSSIWNSGYVIGYANGFFILFLLKQLMTGVLDKRKKELYLLLFALSFVVMLLAAFKALMLAFVISLLFFFFFVGSKEKRAKLLFGVAAIIVIAAFIAISVDVESFDYFIQRFQDSASEEGLMARLEHTGGGIQLDTMFGAGFGHYGMGVKDSNQWFIQDSQYQKILAELGIFGFFLFLIFLLVAFFSAFRSKCILELCILITYIISFIGSSSLNAETTFPFIFWYAVGRISKKSSVAYRVYSPTLVKTQI